NCAECAVILKVLVRAVRWPSIWKVLTMDGEDILINLSISSRVIIYPVTKAGEENICTSFPLIIVANSATSYLLAFFVPASAIILSQMMNLLIPTTQRFS
ncbi:hypothetical protein CUU52_00005, partial [Pectobacterium polaris]|nr:hypothetical protein [Pectobacterium polaris]